MTIGPCLCASPHCPFCGPLQGIFYDDEIDEDAIEAAADEAADHAMRERIENGDW